MNRSLDRVNRGAVFVAILVAVVLLAGTGTVAAQSAPDCSTVTYNGDGTTNNPYEVGNVDQLQCIEEQGLDANYVQVSDIDASETASWNGGDGFEPIGKLSFFEGEFDGADHTITGVTIDRPDERSVALFGISEGKIKNADLDDVDIEGESSVGGLVGSNPFGNIQDSEVFQSSVSGNVTGDLQVGGVIGQISPSSEVVRSFSRADITGKEEARKIGGLAGENRGVVSNSFATGSVDGSTSVGGLVGTNFAGSITESYATGSVVADTTNVGGLVGGARGTVTGSYWDTRSTGQSDSEGGFGLTTSQMTGSDAPNNMFTLSFTDTWVTVTDPEDYPILVWQQPTASFTLSPNNPDVGEAIQFDGLSSSDRDGTIQTYEWDFDGDGTTDQTTSTPTATHTYSNAGTFTVELTVTDDDGATDAATQTVSVSSGSGSLSPNNPFGDSNGNPAGRQTVINRVVQWNLNGEIGGTSFTRQEIINFVVQWNLAN